MWSQTVRQKKKQIALNNPGRQIKCWRTGYESTTQNATPEIRPTKKNTKRTKANDFRDEAGHK